MSRDFKSVAIQFRIKEYCIYELSGNGIAHWGTNSLSIVGSSH